jgi:predicted naringenin-chalcone synthase
MARSRALDAAVPLASLVALGTALPPPCYSQADALAWGLDHVSLAPRTRELYQRVMADGSIARRHFAVDDLSEILEIDHEAILARFERWASQLSSQALGRALAGAGLEPASVDFVAGTTCTGYLCPGLTSYVAETCGLRADVRRVDIVGMGCGAALPALEQACDFLAAHPDGTAAVVCTEICSAAILFGDAPDLVVSNAIFGDGSAAAILRRSSRAGASGRIDAGPRATFLGFRSLTLPEWRETLRFRTQGGHLRNVLSRDVPVRAGTACRRLVLELLEGFGTVPADVSRWAMHAGGKLILDAVERSLELPAAALEAARAVLHDAGNLSSPTVLFVLDEDQRRRPPTAGELGVICAFGAGFSAHAALVEYSA